MTLKYYLSPDGKTRSPDPLFHEYDHADVARTVLKDRGIVPVDYEDLYTQMFQLGYARVAEFGDQVYVENPLRSLTADQKMFLDDKFASGKTVKVNNKIFSETKRHNPNAQEIVERLLQTPL